MGLTEFNRFHRRYFAPDADILEAIHRHSLLGLQKGPAARELVWWFPNKSEWRRYRPRNISPDRWADGYDRLIGRPYSAGDQVRMSEVWMMSRFIGGGPKVFAPTAAEFDALAATELRIPWGEYRQPFDCFAIVIPEGRYSAASADIGTPVVAVANHDTATSSLSRHLYGTGELRMQGDYFYEEELGEEIESKLHSLAVWGDVTAGERSLAVVIDRVAINAALLLTSYGTRRVGVADPARESLLRSKRRNRKRNDDADRLAARDELRRLPVVYGFEQHVKVYDRDDEAEGQGKAGSPVRPHWRRGHWARQVCGAGAADRKWIFRRPLMVNAAGFAGQAAQTRVLLTTAGK